MSTLFKQNEVLCLIKNPSLIVTELQDYSIPLSEDELFNLEKSILEEGCRDPIVVWQGNDNERVVVDGHNRYRICQKHRIPFNHRVIGFDNLDHIKLSMIENQIGRRNLTQDQLSYHRGIILILETKEGWVSK